MKKAFINISFDVEDIYGNQNLLNKSLYDLLQFCDNNKIHVDVYISAIKYSFIKNDNALVNILKNSNYINVGYHSNTHSFYTISEQDSIEKLKSIEEYDFDFNSEKLTTKSGGIKTFLNDFKTSFFRCPGYCWTPDYFDFMKSYGLTTTTIHINSNDIFSYKGIIIIPTLITPLEKIKSIKEINFYLQNVNFLSLYLHPARLIYNHFWDKLKENTYHILKERFIYADYEQKIKFIKALFIHLKENYNLFSASDISLVNYVKQKNNTEFEMKLKNSMVSKWNWSQILTPVNTSYHLEKFKIDMNSLKFGEIRINNEI